MLRFRTNVTDLARSDEGTGLNRSECTICRFFLPSSGLSSSAAQPGGRRPVGGYPGGRCRRPAAWYVAAVHPAVLSPVTGGLPAAAQRHIRVGIPLDETAGGVKDGPAGRPRLPVEDLLRLGGARLRLCKAALI